MCPTCVIVANSSKARFFAMENRNTPLSEIADLVHPASRLHAQTLTSDSPGRSFDSGGQGRHAMEQNVDIKKQEAINFAKQVADYLDKEYERNTYEKIIIIAASDFLGLLRSKLSKRTKQLVEKEIDKNIVQVDEASIRGHLF